MERWNQLKIHNLYFFLQLEYFFRVKYILTMFSTKRATNRTQHLWCKHWIANSRNKITNTLQNEFACKRHSLTNNYSRCGIARTPLRTCINIFFILLSPASSIFQLFKVYCIPIQSIITIAIILRLFYISVFKAISFGTSSIITLFQGHYVVLETIDVIHYCYGYLVYIMSFGRYYNTI